MQGGIYVQGGILFSKSINMQTKMRPCRGKFSLKINKRACTSIRYTRVFGNLNTKYKYQYTETCISILILGKYTDILVNALLFGSFQYSRNTPFVVSLLISSYLEEVRKRKDISNPE